MTTDTFKYPGFLYGHYDSRGGATFVVETDRAAADLLYAGSFDVQGADAHELCEEDSIAQVTLESYRPIMNEEDLEEIGSTASPEDQRLGQAFEAGLQWADDAVAESVPNPHLELLWARFEGKDVKELRLLAPGASPVKKGETWKRSSFGEDAFGLVVVLAPTE